MTSQKTTGRLAPLARRTADDDDFRTAVRRFAESGRSAIFKPAPPPARLQRAGTAIREAGAAISVVGRNAEKQRRAEQRTTRLRAALLGGVATACAAAAYRLSSSKKSQDAERAPVPVETTEPAIQAAEVRTFAEPTGEVKDPDSTTPGSDQLS